MSEPITFSSEGFHNRTAYYDVHEDRMSYRPDDGEEISFTWSEIQHIDDHRGGRIEIQLHDLQEIPIKYSTKDFLVLLNIICVRLADVRKENFRFQKFSLTAKYFLHLSLAVFLLVLSLIVSLSVSKVIFFILLTLSIPLGIFFQRQPVSLELERKGLTFRYLHKEVTVAYHEISNIDFVVLKNDYESTLGVVIRTKSRKDMTIKKIEDIVTFFIMLHIKINECTLQRHS